MRAFLAFVATLPEPPTAPAEDDRSGPPRDHPDDDDRRAEDDRPPHPDGSPQGPPPNGRPFPERNGPPRRFGPPPEGRRPMREMIEKRRPAKAEAAKAEDALLDRATRDVLLRMNPQEPVINVPLPAVRAFARWVEEGLRESGSPGRVRLPTTDEWRLAAGRAEHPDAKFPATGAFPLGDGVPDQSLKAGANWNGRSLHVVKSFAPDARGFYDLVGNAAEITDDGVERGLFLIGGSFWTTARGELELDHARAYRPPEPFSSAAGFRLVFVPAE